MSSRRLIPPCSTRSSGTTGRQDPSDLQVGGLAPEYRDDHLEESVVLNTLALCPGHGGYLHGPCQENDALPALRHLVGLDLNGPSPPEPTA
nr:hypothetical protein [Streptomyces atroolivaceus]